MDKALTADNCYEFIKSLVELGGVHYVDSDLIIRSSMDDNPVTVMTGIPKKQKPIAILKVGMKAGDYVVLNPFTDVVLASPERAWFVNKMCAMPSSIVCHLVTQMIKVGLEKSKDAGYKANKYVSRWADKIDNKLLEEARRIQPVEWAKIVYDRNKRTAQLQSDIGMDELKKKYASKIRKSSWPLFIDMVKTVLQLPMNKKPESLMYETKIASIPKIDAVLHLLIDVLKRLDPAVKIFTEIEIDVKTLEKHIDNLEAYVEATSWFASGTGTQESEASVAPPTAAPWGATSLTSTEKDVAKVAVAGSDAVGVADVSQIASLTPAGVIVNPLYGTPNTAEIPQGLRTTVDATYAETDAIARLGVVGSSFGMPVNYAY